MGGLLDDKGKKMKIAILAYRKYAGGYIAKQKPIRKCIAEYYVDLCERFLKPKLIYLIYDGGIGSFLKEEFKNDKRVKLTSIEDAKKIEDAVVIDMGYFYDFKRMKALIKKGDTDIKKVHYFKIKTEHDIQGIKDFLKRDYRDYFNPIAKHYLEPIGEGLARVCKDTWLTPNFVSIFNVLFFGLIFVILIFIGKYWSMILLAVSIQVYHMFDIMDGHLARLKNMKSSYGAWVDGGGDKFIFQLIFISISLSLFLKEGKILYLILCIFLLAGEGMRSYLAYLTDRFYPGHITEDEMKVRVKKTVFSRLFLFFLENDILYHTLSLFAILNKLGWLLIFYTVYFNLIWLAYVGYFSYRYIKTGN